MPQTLSILMPARLLNLNIVLAGPLVIGLVAASRHRRAAQVLLVGLMVGLLLASKSLLWRWLAAIGIQPWSVRWRELRRTYNVLQIVTRSDYELDLPMVVDADGLRLYPIPD